METAKATIIALLLVLLTVAPARPAGLTTKADTPAKSPPAEKISNTRTANCLVKITCDHAILPLNIDSIESLMCSSGVGQKAARDVLGIPATPVEHFFLIIELPLVDSTGRPRRPVPTTNLSRPPAAFPGGAFQYGGSTTQSGTTPTTTTAPGTRKTTPSPSTSTAKPTTTRGRTSTAQSTPPVATTASSRSTRRSMTPARTPTTTSRQGRTSSTGGYSTYSTTRPTTASRRPTRTVVTPQAPTAEQTLLFQLDVDLTEEAIDQIVKPAAKEFMNALLENLRQALIDAYHDYVKQLNESLALADRHRAEAWEALPITISAPIDESYAIVKGEALNKQLRQKVDLSALSPDMPFSEALETLKNSVEPPLKIVVLWRDLFDNADIEPTTPINMDPIKDIPAEIALKLLLESVAGAFTGVTYRIEGDVIRVTTVEAFELLEELEESHKQNFKTVQIHISPEELFAQKQRLLLSKRSYEMDLARFQARRRAIEEQIIRTKNETEQKVQNDPVTNELQRLLELQYVQLKRTKQLVEQGRASQIDLGGAEEKLARAKIELAQRREQVVKSAGGDRLTIFNDDLAKLSIDTAETTAMLNVVNSQLEETTRQLKATASFDQEAAELRYATRNLEAANQRVNEWKTRGANLQPPTLTVLGAD